LQGEVCAGIDKEHSHAVVAADGDALPTFGK
jgi:hypothetical protein